jgi:hypothetical protein
MARRAERPENARLGGIRGTHFLKVLAKGFAGSRGALEGGTRQGALETKVGIHHLSCSL